MNIREGYNFDGEDTDNSRNCIIKKNRIRVDNIAVHVMLGSLSA
jgi:hypothetical protein